MESSELVLGNYFATLQAERKHDDKFGPSDTGRVCDRRSAFRLQEIPPSDPPGHAMTVADVGSMLHLAWASIMEKNHPGSLFEHPVRIPGLRDGRADCIDTLEPAVIDLKTVNVFRYDAWHDAGGPPEGIWQQVALYAYGFTTDPNCHPELADAQWWLHVDALCREDGRVTRYSRPYDESYAVEALARLVWDAEELGSTPWTQVAPTAGVWCKTCPWRTACLGPDDVPQPAHVTDPAAVVATAEEYMALRAQITDLEARKTKCLAQLGDANGQYGEVFVGYTNPKPGGAMDWKALRAGFVEAYGEHALPKKTAPRARIVRRA
jgi:PD-(D/E)XK nuclease superfamily protein